MYEAEGFQAANELDRFALGDRDPLHYNDDGSLDICLQHTNCPDKESDWLPAHWLPAPLGPRGINVRLYAPPPSCSTAAGTHPLVHKARRPGATGPTSRSPPPVRFNLASTVFDTSAVADTPSRSACL